jgi:hypothetical protein
MQKAEASMADDKGVPVIQLKISHLRGQLIDFGPGYKHIGSVRAFEDLLEDLAVKISSLVPETHKTVALSVLR